MLLRITHLLPRLFSVLLICTISVAAFAADKDDSTDMAALMAGIHAEVKDSLSQKAHDEHILTQIAVEEYDRAALVHRKNTFLWQYSSSKIIFYVVIFIVICGIIYSGIQFYQSMREVRLKEKLVIAREAAARSGEPLPQLMDAKTEMELSTSGIKVTSSLVGILILLISIAFFYMYLIYVYPIDQMKVDVHGAAPGGKTEQVQKK